MLAYAGIIPFVAGCLSVSFEVPVFGIDVDTLLRTYVALIISFLAGMQWQIGISRLGTTAHLLWVSNGFVLASWVVISSAPNVVVWLLYASLFVGLLLIDRYLTNNGFIEPWFYRLRRNVSAIVILTLVVTAAVQI